MALQIRRGQTRSFGKMIAASFAVMAFVLQPLVQSNMPAAFAAGSQTRYVSNTGNDTGDCLNSSDKCLTITYAISQANDGDKIDIADGDYNENITLNKPIKLWGQSSNTRLNGQISIMSGASNSLVHKLFITTVNKEYSLGIFGANNVEVENNTFAGTTSNGASAKAVYVGDADSNGITIRNNMIRAITSNKGAYGILINKKSFSDLVIKDNHIKTLKGDWVHAIGLEGNTPNALIQNNHISGLSSSTNNSDVRGVFFEDNSSASTVKVNGDLNGKTMTNSTSLTVADAALTAAANAEVLCKDGVYRYFTQNAFTTAQAAVNAVDVDGVVKLLSDQNVTSSILIKKALTFDGNGLSVVSSFGAGATSQYSGVIEVQGVSSGVVRFVANNNKQFRVHGEGNKAIDGPGNYNGLHGINVYRSNIEINNVNLENNGKSGLNLGKDSTATIANLMTNNNMWHGVDVDKGGVLTINNTSKHNESKMHNGKAVASLYVDNSTGTVYDEDTQYTAVKNYLQQGDTAYFLKHEAPKATVTVGSLSQNATTNNKNITVTGTAAPSATTGSAIKTHYFELVTPTGATYAIYSDKTLNRCDLNGTNECTFNLGSYYDIDGQYKIRYVVTDLDGIRNDGFKNPVWVTGESQAAFTFFVDATAPVLTIDTSYRVNGDGTYTISGTTDSTDVVTVTFAGVTTTVTPVNGVWRVTTGAIADGTYTATAKSTDTAGNEATATRTYINVHTPISGQQATVEPPANALRAPARPAQFFAAASQGAVLGDSTEGDKSVAAVKTGQVEGASTTKSDDNAAKAGGMAAWFWWILAAAIASFVWWLIAAARKRASDNN